MSYGPRFRQATLHPAFCALKIWQRNASLVNWDAVRGTATLPSATSGGFRVRSSIHDRTIKPRTQLC
jgi:hypothetical protein